VSLEKLDWTLVRLTSPEGAFSIGSSWPKIALLLIALALAVAAGSFVASQMLRQISHVGELLRKLRVGDYRARAEVVSNDELGAMTADLNVVLSETFQLVQSKTEREELQNSVIKLLNDVSGVAEGDLTGEAEVRPDVTGAIADAFNYMMVELRQIIGRVQSVTQEVSSSANTTQATTERLAEESEKQAHQILATREAIEAITDSIRRVSEIALESRGVANRSLETAKHGAEAVRETVRGMNSLREQVQQTSKRIKRLGENSQEIGEMVQLISEIAYRTSVLALNASIQAARAGEAGRGFAVVAEEVEGLAKRSTDAAKRITELVNEAIYAMEESTREVVQGSNLADQAGRSLVEIEAVSSSLASMVQTISAAAERQASDSQTISRVMAEISEFTQYTASGIKESSASVNNLAELALALRSSVASFRLPGNNGNNQYYARN
jgi:twitching motility protein PilJ